MNGLLNCLDAVKVQSGGYWGLEVDGVISDHAPVHPLGGDTTALQDSNQGPSQYITNIEGVFTLENRSEPKLVFLVHCIHLIPLVLVSHCNSASAPKNLT